MRYRPEIDGLRTIAVLSVIIYHAQIVEFGHSFFKGGFVGVDIFFVISGYLISRILLSELFEKGKISFLQFYERRARRILPILFIVFLASFPLAYKYLLPNQFIEYAQSILSATFFSSNIFFYFTNTQYGAEDSLLQPFLHTWSLGVEEQFYILFPIVLLLAYKFAKNHLVTIIAVLVLISLQYADWQSIKNTQLNFFMLTSRLWELGIGSLLAFYELKYGRVKHELLNQTMPLLGLAMITHSIIFFNNQTPHPSLITLLPTLGTALIILYSVNKTDLVGKVLSWKPIVGIGLISYSMYLWHYPLFAFARIGDSNGLHNVEKYLLILLTIVLSSISYFLIEKPFRNKQLLNGKKFSAAILILLIGVLGVNWKVIETKGYKERLTSLLKKDKSNFSEAVGNKLKIDNEKKAPSNSILTPIKCDGFKGIEEGSCYVYGNKNSNLTVLIWGDSHANQLRSAIKAHTPEDIKVISISHAGCPPLIDMYRFDGLGNSKNCNNKDVLLNYANYINHIKPDIVVLSARWPMYFNGYQKRGTLQGQHCIMADSDENISLVLNSASFRKDLVLKKIKETVNYLSSEKVYVLISPPDLADIGLTKEILTSGVVDYSKIKPYNSSVKRILDEKKLLNVIDTKEYFCTDEVCRLTMNGFPLYKDDNHSSYEGRKLIYNVIIDKLKEINNP